MKLENQNILITSNEPWSDVWFSKHNYAWELSKKNKVYFINSPGKWKLRNLFSNAIETTAITETLSVISIQNIFPSNLNALKELNNFIISKRLKAYMNNRGLQDWMLWSFTPLFLFRPYLLQCKFTVFHIMDMNWTNFYGAKLLSQFADRLILVSEHILPEYKFCTKQKLVIGHGISEEEFFLEDSKLSLVKKEMEGYEDFGLYVGVIDKRCDFPLIKKMAEAMSSTTFVFVGPLNIPGDHPYINLFNGKTKNIVSLGKRPYKELKYYISLSKFCVSPMDLSYSGNELSHHKTFTYLAQGKPVFGPPFKAYHEIDELLYTGNSHDVIIQKIVEFQNKGEAETLKTKRINYIKQFLYSSHLSKIEQFFNS
ncbi:MAG TPA: hypothetical protein PLC65_03810 [Bacteroidia bacterium]|nr:hypothetical protein [Bacteroidia bacterium]